MLILCKLVEVCKCWQLVWVVLLVSLLLFFLLEGCKVVFVGGIDVVVWKVEFLVVVGVEVYVYVEMLIEMFQVLFNKGSVKGSFLYQIRFWDMFCFDGVVFVIVDVVSGGEVQVFYCVVKVKGVLVNVIDNLFYCEFQFGLIVNWLFVVIGILINGVVLIFGQVICCRIEMLLFVFFQDWVVLVGWVWVWVLERLVLGGECCCFWECFNDLVFLGKFIFDVGLLELFLEDVGEIELGRVMLVGVGLGDVENLMFKVMWVL